VRRAAMFSERMAMVAGTVVLAVATAVRGDVDVDLTFGSLPSAQGWNYLEQGVDADGETSNFTATGSLLQQRRHGGGLGSSPGGARYLLSALGTYDPTKPVYARFRAS